MSCVELFPWDEVYHMACLICEEMLFEMNAVFLDSQALSQLQWTALGETGGKPGR